MGHTHQPQSLCGEAARCRAAAQSAGGLDRGNGLTLQDRVKAALAEALTGITRHESTVLQRCLSRAIQSRRTSEVNWGRGRARELQIRINSMNYSLRSVVTLSASPWTATESRGSLWKAGPAAQSFAIPSSVDVHGDLFGGTYDQVPARVVPRALRALLL